LSSKSFDPVEGSIGFQMRSSPHAQPLFNLLLTLMLTTTPFARPSPPLPIGQGVDSVCSWGYSDLSRSAFLSWYHCAATLPVRFLLLGFCVSSSLPVFRRYDVGLDAVLCVLQLAIKTPVCADSREKAPIPCSFSDWCLFFPSMRRSSPLFILFIMNTVLPVPSLRARGAACVGSRLSPPERRETGSSSPLPAQFELALEFQQLLCFPHSAVSESSFAFT